MSDLMGQIVKIFLTIRDILYILSKITSQGTPQKINVFIG